MDMYSLKENTAHGTVSFPLALYEWNGAAEWKVSAHWHDEMELICFKRGTFPVWHNTREYTVTGPAIMCIHAGEIHSLILKKDCQESAIVFNLNILSFEHYDAIQAKLIGPLLDGRLKMPLFINNDEAVFSRIKDCYENMEQRLKEMNTGTNGDELIRNAAYLQIKALLLQMLAILYQNGYFSSLKKEKQEDEYRIARLKTVIGHINKNYTAPVRLDELAGLVNMNPQYFCRYFKENIGKTITEYINELRIEKAAEALSETDDKIIDIAQNTGFENTSYFIRRFKTEKGMTPSEYRKAAKSQNSSTKLSIERKKISSLDNIIQPT